jgi:hypothetical protein
VDFNRVPLWTSGPKSLSLAENLKFMQHIHYPYSRYFHITPTTQFNEWFNREKQKARKQTKKMTLPKTHAHCKNTRFQQRILMDIRAQKPEPCRKIYSICNISLTQIAGNFYVTPTTQFHLPAQQTLHNTIL